METITRYFLLEVNNQRGAELPEPPVGVDVRFEKVRIEVHQNDQGESYEVETHSVKQFGLTVVEQPNPLAIMISSVTGAIMHNSSFTHITCNELENITVTGALNVPDRTFSMPIRRDNGSLILFPVSVVNGEFEAVLNFPTSGQYTYSDEEANIDLPPNTFTVAPIKIDVLRPPV